MPGGAGGAGGAWLAEKSAEYAPVKSEKIPAPSQELVYPSTSPSLLPSFITNSFMSS